MLPEYRCGEGVVGEERDEYHPFDENERHRQKEVASVSEKVMVEQTIFSVKDLVNNEADHEEQSDDERDEDGSAPPLVGVAP